MVFKNAATHTRLQAPGELREGDIVSQRLSKDQLYILIQYLKVSLRMEPLLYAINFHKEVLIVHIKLL